MNSAKSWDTKVLTEKSFAFLHANNEKSGREIAGINSIHHCNERINILGITYLRRQRTIYGKLQDNDERNQDDINIWRHSLCSHQVGRINIAENDYITKYQSTD